MVSEWMPNGNVRDYVRKNPETSRLQLVRWLQSASGFELTRVQLLDVGRGLSFLHFLEIVHGDLKGVRLDSFLCCPPVVGNLTTSRRIMFSLTSQAVRDSMISGSPASLASTVRRLLPQGSRDPIDGWRRSFLTSIKENLVSARATQMFLLWEWLLLR